MVASMLRAALVTLLLCLPAAAAAPEAEAACPKGASSLVCVSARDDDADPAWNASLRAGNQTRPLGDPDFDLRASGESLAEGERRKDITINLRAQNGTFGDPDFDLAVGCCPDAPVERRKTISINLRAWNGTASGDPDFDVLLVCCGDLDGDGTDDAAHAAGSCGSGTCGGVAWGPTPLGLAFLGGGGGGGSGGASAGLPAGGAGAGYAQSAGGATVVGYAYGGGQVAGCVLTLGGGPPASISCFP